MFYVGTYGTYVGLRLFPLSLCVSLSLVAKIEGRGARRGARDRGQGLAILHELDVWVGGWMDGWRQKPMRKLGPRTEEVEGRGKG